MSQGGDGIPAESCAQGGDKTCRVERGIDRVFVHEAYGHLLQQGGRADGGQLRAAVGRALQGLHLAFEFANAGLAIA